MWDMMPCTQGGLVSSTEDLLRFGIMLQQWGRLGGTRILGRKAVEVMSSKQINGIPTYCWGENKPDVPQGLGFTLRRFTGSLISPGAYSHEGAGASMLIIDPVTGLVCVCVYPWVNGEWNGDCNNRFCDVVWSGLI